MRERLVEAVPVERARERVFARLVAHRLELFSEAGNLALGLRDAIARFAQLAGELGRVVRQRLEARARDLVIEPGVFFGGGGIACGSEPLQHHPGDILWCERCSHSRAL